MDDREFWAKIRGLSIPVLAILFALCALTGCSAGEGFSSIHLGSIGSSAKGEQDLLILVNPWNPLPEDYEPELATLSDGTQVASCCLEDLRRLLHDCREAGYEPYICSAYRTWDYQSMLFENKVGRLMAEGMDEIAARAEAATVVALPGTSEHQLGLALDIVDSGYTQLDEGQMDTPTQRWLMENSWRYGFILRYPEGKSDITGIIFEPWHYRYVGVENAKEIYESGLCLEEWLEEQ